MRDAVRFGICLQKIRCPNIDYSIFSALEYGPIGSLASFLLLGSETPHLKEPSEGEIEAATTLNHQEKELILRNLRWLT